MDRYSDIGGGRRTSSWRYSSRNAGSNRSASPARSCLFGYLYKYFGGGSKSSNSNFSSLFSEACHKEWEAGKSTNERHQKLSRTGRSARFQHKGPSYCLLYTSPSPRDR